MTAKKGLLQARLEAWLHDVMIELRRLEPVRYTEDGTARYFGLERRLLHLQERFDGQLKLPARKRLSVRQLGDIQKMIEKTWADLRALLSAGKLQVRRPGNFDRTIR